MSINQNSQFPLKFLDYNDSKPLEIASCHREYDKNAD